MGLEYFYVTCKVLNMTKPGAVMPLEVAESHIPYRKVTAANATVKFSREVLAGSTRCAKPVCLIKT